MQLSQRTRRIFASGLSVAGARVVTVLCSFVAMPLCLGYLGLPAFGVWATVTSVVALLAFADLGIGNGVLNMLSAALGRDDTTAIRRITATAFVILAGLGAVLFAVYLAASAVVPWDSALGATGSVSPAAAASAVLVLATVLALSLPSAMIQRLQFALQMGYLNGMAQAGGGVLSLVFIYLVSRTTLGLPGMVAATLVAPLIAVWVSGLWMFARQPNLLPAAQDFSPGDVRPILRSGSQFLLLGVVFCLCQTSDSLIIAKLLGPSEVANFAVHQKYVSPIIFIGGLALTPLWAAYGEALARGDLAWIKRAFRRSLLGVLVAGATLTVVLLALLQPLMHLWLKGRIEPDFWMAGSLLVWASLELVGKAVSIFLHGMGLVGQQVWIALVFLPLCLGAKVLFGQAYGAPGVVLGTAVAYLLAHAWPYWRLVSRWHSAHPGLSR